jgi:hypothetical protein
VLRQQIVLLSILWLVVAELDNKDTEVVVEQEL